MAIRVGIIGRNFVVDWMLAAMEQVSELRPAAIYSRNEETGREFAKKYHLDAVFTDLEAFAASDAFDAAYIASPNLCHFDQAMCLLRHGKHVLLEKPGVLTRKQTETLVETANANHVVYLEAMRLVFDDALPIIRDALPEIGTLRRVTAEFTQYSSRYDRVRAGEPHINAFDPALCNAAILDMGCYPIHALISMFGEPAHVSAEAYHLESGFEAGGIALLRYDGFVCEAIWSKVCKQAAPTTFMGEDGSILLDDINHIRRIWLVRRSGETVELPYREFAQLEQHDVRAARIRGMAARPSLRCGARARCGGCG